MNIPFSYRCKDFQSHSKAWYSFLRKINSIILDVPLWYLNDDYTVGYDVDSIYIKTFNLIQGRQFIYITVKGQNTDHYINIGACLKQSDFCWPTTFYYNLVINIPLYFLVRKKGELISKNIYFELFSELCELLPVYKAAVHHPQITYAVSIQHSSACDTALKHGLPALDYFYNYEMDEFMHPHQIEWIGYRDKYMIEYIGMTNIKKCTLYIAIFTNNGGFIYQATRDPLNEDDPGHMEILKRNYLQMRKIGAQNLLNIKTV